MKKYTRLLLLVVIPMLSWAQESQSSDDLFLLARNEAFENKNYKEAIRITQQALDQSPDYTDIAIFLGRLYTWDDEVDKARQVFSNLLQKNVSNTDFYMAYASLEYWNDQENRAIDIINLGLTYNPKSEDLLLLRAKVQFSMDMFLSTEDTLNELLLINPKNTEARMLATRLKEFSAKNAIGITYNLSHFDKQFEDNWHIVALSYKRATKYGSVVLRGNFANKFNDNGSQIELEAYPKLSKTFYMYVGAGYSNNVGIFPKFRTGASLFANLPKSFEGEIGFRQLHFSKNLWMYTASLGKYYKNYWFNLRTYLTPDSKNISQSYTGTIRYYTKGSNDYFGLIIGSGISPEEHRNNLLENELFKLRTFKIGVDYNFSVSKSNLFSISTMYFNQEYRPKITGNQFDVFIGYTKTF